MAPIDAEFASPARVPRRAAAGEWINDPNALLYADGAYRLFVQHRADAPEFRATGWARLSSPDLLRWTFDGVVIPPGGPDWAYSGSVQAMDGALTAIHTEHSGGLERQVRRTSHDGGASWSAGDPVPKLGAPARNRRDPFVFRDGDGWALLLAEPCDWTEWRTSPPSRLRLYRSADARSWQEAGTIGPWHPPGVMWEVPVVTRIDGRDVLFVSTVDRRADGAACAVRAWVGTLGEDGFELDRNAPVDGHCVDMGPDFYALMSNVEEGWPDAGRRSFVAWAGSWGTARQIGWPGFHGGPITLPRSLALEPRGAGLWLAHRPGPGLLDRFLHAAAEPVPAGVATTTVAAGAKRIELRLAGPVETLEIRLDVVEGSAAIERRGRDAVIWSARPRFPPAAPGPRSIVLFVDGPLVEFFLLEDGWR
jgi:sucrose-6-phosphate hydrolase SacC (GH32 family)